MVFSAGKSAGFATHCFTPLWGRRPSSRFERKRHILEVSVRRNGPSPPTSVLVYPDDIVSQAYHHAKTERSPGFEINYRRPSIGDIRICLGICELFEGGIVDSRPET